MEIDLHNKKLSYLKKLSLEFHRSWDCPIQLTNQITKFLSNPDQSEQNKHDFSKLYINQYRPFLLQRPHIMTGPRPSIQVLKHLISRASRQNSSQRNSLYTCSCIFKILLRIPIISAPTVLWNQRILHTF